MNPNHKERKHSKFSASGSERWINCPPSVYLEEKSPPSKDSEASLDGTKTHEVHETILDMYNEGIALTMKNITSRVKYKEPARIKRAMMSVNKIIETAEKCGGEIIPETRISQEFIHEEMFGTCDATILDHFGRLHIFDYKDGQGHIVTVEENTQLIQYALGWAYKYDWNFEDVELHICQPKAGKTWHKSWVLSIEELATTWAQRFHKAALKAERAEKDKTPTNKGSWCHWCRAKAICPSQNESRFNKITERFQTTKGGKNGKQEKSKKEKIIAQAKKAGRFEEAFDEESFFGAEGYEDVF
jgi:hypothetical protein